MKCVSNLSARYILSNWYKINCDKIEIVTKLINYCCCSDISLWLSLWTMGMRRLLRRASWGRDSTTISSSCRSRYVLHDHNNMPSVAAAALAAACIIHFDNLVDIFAITVFVHTHTRTCKQIFGIAILQAVKCTLHGLPPSEVGMHVRTCTCNSHTMCI